MDSNTGKQRALLVTEKPSVMIEIKKAYEKIKYKLPYDIDFTCAAGHLVGLCEPDEYCSEWGQPWTKDVLPMIPSNWKTKIINPKVYNNIRDMWLSNSYDLVINAGDPGIEGQLIQKLIYHSLGVNVPELRLWADDTTEKTLMKALFNLKPDSLFDGLTDASYLRLYFDWLVGMNFSRAVTLSLGRISRVGRVMTPTLALVVAREKEINNFIPQEYFVIEAEFKNSDGIVYKGSLINPKPIKTLPSSYAFDNYDIATNLVSSLASQGKITELTQKDSISYAPSLFNLTDLQKYCASNFKYDPSYTLSTAQELYEKGYLSYPRTESRHITTEQSKEMLSLLSSLSVLKDFTSLINAMLNNKPICEKILTSKRYVNDKLVSDHPALLPTPKIPDLSALSEREQNVYIAVVKRMLAIFMPPHIVNSTQIITTVGNLSFKTTGSVLKQLGWKALYPKNTKDEDDEDLTDSPLFNLKENTVSSINSCEVLNKETKAPARYTYSSILDAMEKAGKQLDDKELEKVLMECSGLGTPATRAEILKKLEDYNYIYKKSNNLLPTQEGIDLINSLDGHNIISPELTAQWQKKLKEVENKELSYDKFYEVMVFYIKNEVAALLGLKSIGRYSEKIGKCPLCGDDFSSYGQYFACNRYITKDDNGNRLCSLAFSKKIGNKTFTNEDAKALIEGKVTKPKKITWKNKKTTESCFVLKDGKIEFAKMERKILGPCPICGSDVLKGKGFFCKNAAIVDDNGNRQCSFSVFPKIGNTTVTDAQFSQILKKGITDKEIKIKWNSGNESSGRLILDEENRISVKQFEKIEVCKCTKCYGGTIYEEKFYYKCNHLSPTGSCEVQIPKSFLGASILKKDVIDLLNDNAISKKLKFKNGTADKMLRLKRDPDKGYIIAWEK